MRPWALLVVCFLSCSLPGAGATKAAFAYSEGQTIHIADAHGHPVAVLRVPERIGTFSIDSTANHVAVQTYGNYGGELLWCSMEKQSCKRLTHGPYYFGSETESREVYADPSLDPTGSLVAFAVRTEFRNPAQAKEEDIVEASGPLAVMDIPKKQVRILRATLDKSAGGPFFANSPVWSPDGTRILFCFEVGGAISDASGTRLQDLSDAMAGSAKDSYTQPLMWLSNEARGLAISL